MKVNENHITSQLGRPSKGRVSAYLALGAALILTPVVNGQIFDYENISTNNEIVGLPTLGAFSQDRADALVGTSAVKITRLLSDADATSWFNALSLEHIFLDIEKSRVVINTRKTVQQTAGTASAGAFVGNFNVDPLDPDPTQPSDPNIARTIGSTQAGYSISLATMSNENLYPGSPSFRTPAAGDSSNPAGSDAPNIRSALFTLPILRATGVENMRGADVDPGVGEVILFPESHGHIPYVTRFNNFGNSNLNTGLEVGSDRDAENVVADRNGVQYVFDARPGATNEGQLMSRGDFQAQISHLRLRGAGGINLFQPGVVDYTKEQQQADAVAGWKFLDNEFDDLTELVSSEDALFDEESGSLWSAIVQNDGQDDLMAVLLSNLGDESTTIELPETIGGFDVADGQRSISVGANEHILADFGVFLGKWHLLNSPDAVFALGDGNGIGIPEPASIVMLAIGSLLVGLPRSVRRR